MDETIKEMSDSHQRLSVVTILLASIAFTLVIVSIVAFLYNIRKGLSFDERFSLFFDLIRIDFRENFSNTPFNHRIDYNYT